jgi:hypothetical protein
VKSNAGYATILLDPPWDPHPYSDKGKGVYAAAEIISGEQTRRLLLALGDWLNMR